MEDQILAVLEAKGYDGTVERPFPEGAGVWRLTARPDSLTKSLPGEPARATSVNLTADSGAELLAKVQRLPGAA